MDSEARMNKVEMEAELVKLKDDVLKLKLAFKKEIDPKYDTESVKV